MNKLFLVLLALAAFFWWLRPPVHQQTLVASDPHSFNSRAPMQFTTPAGHILEIAIPGADMRYYDVAGRSAEEIRDNLNRRHAGGGFDAFTGWSAHWSWPGIGSNDCNLAAADLDTSLSVRLPRWQAPSDADPALVLKWNSYLGNLAHHEQGHVQIAQQGFAKLQHTLQTSSCDEADAKLNDVLSEMRETDRRYDSETDHGTSQGAKFP